MPRRYVVASAQTVRNSVYFLKVGGDVEFINSLVFLLRVMCCSIALKCGRNIDPLNAKKCWHSKTDRDGGDVGDGGLGRIGGSVDRWATPTEDLVTQT
jgi:hypothetical protein